MLSCFIYFIFLSEYLSLKIFSDAKLNTSRFDTENAESSKRLAVNSNLFSKLKQYSEP